MLDKKAQKSLLDNAAAVNQAILDAAVGQLKELKEDLDTAKEADKGTGDDFHEKLVQKANQSIVIQTAKFIEMYGEPGTGSTPDAPKFVVKEEIQNSIKGIQDLMQQRKIADEAVEEKLQITKETSTVSSTSRTSQTLKDLIGGDYIKDGEPTIRINSDKKIISFSLKVKSKIDGKPEMFICYLYSIADQKMGQYSFTDDDVYTNLAPPTPEQEKDKDYISTVEEMKKNIYFIAWDAAVESTAPASLPQKETYNFQPMDGTVYESADKKDVAKLLQDSATGDVAVYLPFLKNKALYYFYVERTKDFDIKEEADENVEGNAQSLTDDKSIKAVQNANELFFQWWQGQTWKTSVTPSAPPKPSGIRGTENIFETWKSSNYHMKYFPSVKIPVGTLVSLISSELEFNKGNHRDDLSKYGLTLTPSNTTDLKRVMFNSKNVVGVSVVTRFNVETPTLENVIEFLSNTDQLAIMNQAIATNEELYKKFRDITAQDVLDNTPEND